MTDYKAIAAALDTTLGTVKGILDMPGVNLIPYVPIVSTALGAIQAGVKAGVNVAPFVIDFVDTFKDGPPSQDKVDALNLQIAALESMVDAALPPAEAGEEE
jgi:hypothetical protein